MAVSDVHIETEVGPLIQLLGDLHGGIGIQNGILEDAHGQHGTPDLMKPGRDVEAPGPFRQDAEAHQIPVRHCCRRVDDGLPELLKDPGGIDLFPEVQIKLFPVLLFRQTDPLVQDLVLGVQDMRGRGTKDPSSFMASAVSSAMSSTV